MKQRERTRKEQRIDNQRVYGQMEVKSISAKANKFSTGSHTILEKTVLSNRI